MKTFDLVIIGSGPGGLKAAQAAAGGPLKTALVSESNLGGRANWSSLLPSKVWLQHATQLSHSIQQDGRPGAANSASEAVESIKKQIRDLSGLMAEKYQNSIKASNVSLFQGKAFLLDTHTLEIQSESGTEKIKFSRLIMATGSGPFFLPDIKPNGNRIIAPRLTPKLREIPPSIIMVGAGATGTEYAYAFRRFGSQVTIVTDQSTVLPQFEEEITSALEKNLDVQGIRMIFDSPVRAVSQHAEKVSVERVNGKKLTADYAFIAIGRKPDLSFLERAEVSFDQNPDGSIFTNEFAQTSIPHIYATGDVTGAPMVANKAILEADVAMGHILHGEDSPIKKAPVIEAVYTHPEIAQFFGPGYKEKRKQLDTKINNFADFLKDNLTGHAKGMIKIYAERSNGTLAGAAGIGEHVTELMATLQIAVSQGMSLQKLESMAFAYPSLSEVLTG